MQSVLSAVSVLQADKPAYTKLPVDNSDKGVGPPRLFYNRSGTLDELFAVSQFWSEKWLIVLVFCQDLGIIWSYRAFNLPYFWYRRTAIFRTSVLDFRATYREIPDLAGGQYDPFIMNKVLWAVFNLVFLTWMLVNKVLPLVLLLPSSSSCLPPALCLCFLRCVRPFLRFGCGYLIDGQYDGWRLIDMG